MMLLQHYSFFPLLQGYYITPKLLCTLWSNSAATTSCTTAADQHFINCFTENKHQWLQQLNSKWSHSHFNTQHVPVCACAQISIWLALVCHIVLVPTPYGCLDKANTDLDNLGLWNSKQETVGGCKINSDYYPELGPHLNAVGSQVQDRHGYAGLGVAEATKLVRGWSILWRERGWRSWVCSAWWRVG